MLSTRAEIDEFFEAHDHTLLMICLTFSAKQWTVHAEHRRIHFLVCAANDQQQRQQQSVQPENLNQ